MTRRPKVLELLQKQVPVIEDSQIADLSWAAQGNCVGKNPDLFFASSPSTVARAKAICSQCPVQRKCLEFAIDGNESGVWGGTTEAERLEAYAVRPKELRVSKSEVIDFISEFLTWDVPSLSEKYEVDSRTIHRWRKKVREDENAMSYTKVS